eukprot:Lithocolla_globosa_v1_NODE_4573_length_1408_cov_5.390983.p2 type:complete len:120 gc:universal NODE_4573_length_1408_cov_5.390983:437-78(-)
MKQFDVRFGWLLTLEMFTVLKQSCLIQVAIDLFNASGPFGMVTVWVFVRLETVVIDHSRSFLFWWVQTRQEIPFLEINFFKLFFGKVNWHTRKFIFATITTVIYVTIFFLILLIVFVAG